MHNIEKWPNMHGRFRSHLRKLWKSTIAVTMTKFLENSINSEKASEVLRIWNFQISIALCISWRGNGPNAEFFLVLIFPHSDWIRRDTISPYSVQMRQNTDQKKLHIWTLFTLCICLGFGTQLCHWAPADFLGFLATSGKIS